MGSVTSFIAWWQYVANVTHSQAFFTDETNLESTEKGEGSNEKEDLAPTPTHDMTCVALRLLSQVSLD